MEGMRWGNSILLDITHDTDQITASYGGCDSSSSGGEEYVDWWRQLAVAEHRIRNGVNEMAIVPICKWLGFPRGKGSSALLCWVVEMKAADKEIISNIPTWMTHYIPMVMMRRCANRLGIYDNEVTLIIRRVNETMMSVKKHDVNSILWKHTL